MAMLATGDAMTDRARRGRQVKNDFIVTGDFWRIDDGGVSMNVNNLL